MEVWGMGKTNTRLETARRVYREALEAARATPTSEAWGKLLAAGKELSAAQEPRTRSGRRSRRNVTPTIHDLEEAPTPVRELEGFE
jgi:hypothetical protein